MAGRLVKPRNQWPPDELINRAQEVIDNPPVLDRRLAELSPAGQQLLALIGRSQQMDWALGNVVELLMSLGHTNGMKEVLDLLDAGFLFPDLSTISGKLGTFDQWVMTAGTTGLTVFTLPQIASRASASELELPELPTEPAPLGAPVMEA